MSELKQTRRITVNIHYVWGKADSLRGGLYHLRTKDGRRRRPEYVTEFGVESFVDDECAILESKAFRNMARKTQVVTIPQSAMIRNRLSHVMEVVGQATRLSEALGLNTNLVRAASLGHDMGHVPFGHPGEAWMQGAMKRHDFCHEVMGVVIAQHIERRGRGLDLCHETLEAMMRHSGNLAKEGMTQEACLLRYADKIAYLFHDVNDILDRLGYPAKPELLQLIDEFGDNQRRRTRTARSGLIIESVELGRVSFEELELGIKFQKLRDLMYEIYPKVIDQNVGATMEKLLRALETFDLADPFMLLALMNDTDAIYLSSVASPSMEAFKRTDLWEIRPYLAEIGKVDLCDPDLNW